MRTPWAVLLLVGLLAACDAPRTGPSATPTMVAASRVEIIGDGPVFEPAATTGYAFLLPGAALEAGGAAHAWVIGFGEERGDQEVMRLVSADGEGAWEVADRRVGRSIGLAFDPPGPIPSSVLAPEDGGEWVMYFAASPDGGDDGSDIWRATAPAPEGPWTADPEPVLARVDLPTEDGSTPTQVDFPAVIRTDAGYRMLFGWSPSRATTLVRSATSTDGVSWTVDDPPAIDLGLCGGFDTRSVAMPRIAAHPAGGWIALYGGFGDETDASMAVGLARSADGVAWTCAAPGPILEVGDIPGSERIHSYALVADGGGSPRRLLIESLVGNESELWLAELSLD